MIVVKSGSQEVMKSGEEEECDPRRSSAFPSFLTSCGNVAGVQDNTG